MAVVLCSVMRDVRVWLEELDFTDREKEKMEKKKAGRKMKSSD